MDDALSINAASATVEEVDAPVAASPCVSLSAQASSRNALSASGPIEGANGSCVHREAETASFLCRSNGAGNGARPDAKTRRYDRQLRYVLAAGRPSAVRRSGR